MKLTDISFATFGRTISKNRLFPERAQGINKLYYINEGSIRLETADGVYKLEEGHLYLIPQSLIISLFAEYTDHTFFDFFTAPLIINDSILDITLSNHPLIESSFQALNMFVEKYPMKRITHRNHYYDYVKSSLNNLLFLISEEFKILTVNDLLINQAIDYIHHNYFNDISVSHLAEKFHLEEGTFIRRFKRVTSTTPYKYIRNLRINIASALAKEGSYTLSEIASMVGYCDAASLSHAIKACLTIKF